MKVEYFRTKNWNISKRSMELFEDRVQPDSGGSTFSPSSKCSQGFSRSSLAKTVSFNCLEIY